MRVISLGSGSSGNALLLETEETTLLLDVGLPLSTLQERAQAVGTDLRQVNAILLSHEHNDHIRGLESFMRFHPVRVYTGGLLREMARDLWAHGVPVTPFLPGRPFRIREWKVLPFAVPHDARAPVGFLLQRDGFRVGWLVDTGHVNARHVRLLAECDLCIVEANHSRKLLQEGPYPPHLKARIASPLGHLSNEQTAQLLGRVLRRRAEAPEIVLAHLSEVNNAPAVARDEIQRTLGRTLPLQVLPREAPHIILD